MSGPLSEQVREALREWRIGSVPYLNARPLTEGISDRLTFEVPAKLAASFRSGRLDAALIPIYEAINLGRATVANDVAIASSGEVYSVILASRQPVDAVRSVALDPDSRTSSHLVQCLFKEFFSNEVAFTERPQDAGQPRVIIGDPAMRFREEHADGEWIFTDLGGEWKRRTGLPFVFACWVFHPSAGGVERLAGLLREVKAHGIANREAIAARTPDPAFTLKYLTDHVRYDLGDEEKRAIALFAELLRKHGLAQSRGAFEIRYA